MFLLSLKFGLFLKKNESVFLKIHRCMIDSIHFITELRYLSSIKPGDYCPKILNGQTQMNRVCTSNISREFSREFWVRADSFMSKHDFYWLLAAIFDLHVRTRVHSSLVLVRVGPGFLKFSRFCSVLDFKICPLWSRANRVWAVDPLFGRRFRHGHGHRFGHEFGRGLGHGKNYNFGLGFGHGHEIFKDFGHGLGHGQTSDTRVRSSLVNGSKTQL